MITVKKYFSFVSSVSPPFLRRQPTWGLMDGCERVCARADSCAHKWAVVCPRLQPPPLHTPQQGKKKPDQPERSSQKWFIKSRLPPAEICTGIAVRDESTLCRGNPAKRAGQGYL